MALDLNLLVALDALLEEGSVAGAADRLHLSQPAMSRTLARIRRSTADQILVRSGRAMIPTPYALAIRENVHALVQQAEAVLLPARSLDLATLERVFTLQFHDAFTVAIGPALLASIRTAAPGVALRLLAETPVDATNLRYGRVDMTIGSSEPDVAGVRSADLGRDRLSLVAAIGNPLLRGELTVERYASAKHLIVSRRGRLRDPIDDLLEERGLRRQVVASAPGMAAALHLVSGSDLVVSVAEQLGRPMVDALGLQMLSLPFELPPVPAILSWHQRYDDDLAHAWLRTVVQETIQSVCGLRR